MTNPAPLSVDPEQLGLAGGQLLTSAGQLPAAPAPFMPSGTDPLSLAIIGQIPIVDGRPMAELPVVQTQSMTTARNVVDAAEAYASTDQQLGGQIGNEMQNSPGATGSGSGSAGSMNHLMSMPMQMAQMPMQVMGAVAAGPQGAMQGAQQVGQVAGKFGGMGGPSGVAGQGDPSGAKSETPGGDREGAAPGQAGSERAPEFKDQDDKASSDSQAPGRHRIAEPSVAEPTDDSINL